MTDNSKTQSPAPNETLNGKTELLKKDALELYENGKHRRYNLLFAVNGGAFAVAKFMGEKGENPVALSIIMILFTIIMAIDIYKFGEKYRGMKNIENEVFDEWGKGVLYSLTVLICAGWITLYLSHFNR